MYLTTLLFRRVVFLYLFLEERRNVDHMNKRIMTVDELYSFCLKNKFAKFDSKEFGKELIVEMPANFEKSDNETDKMTEGLTPFVSRAFHDHINLNKSEIKEQDFNDNLPSSNLRPILANIVKDEETGELDFGAHDFHIEKIIQIDQNGNESVVEKTVYDEQPIGVIDGSKTSIEYDEEAKVNRAVLHGYLYNEYCQDAIDILNRRGTVDCSVELVIREMSFDASSKVLVLNDFYVSGLTLLSSKTKPGMAGSNFKIEDFSIDNDYFKFTNRLNELQAKLDELEARFIINNSSRREEEIEVENIKDNFEEVTEEEVTETEETTEEEVTVAENESDETVDETSEEESVEVTENEEETTEEEAEVKEDNACGGGSGSKKKKKKKCSEENESMIRSYEISHDDIRYALYNLLSSYEELDNEWYYITGVYDAYFVYESCNAGKIYGQKYTKDNDVVAFDGERYILHKEYLTDLEYAEIQNMRSNYAELKAYKENTENEKLHAQREEIINSEKYAVLAEKNESGEFINEKFAKLVSEMDNYSLTDLEMQIKVIHSDYITEHATFSEHAKEPEKKIVSKKQFSNPEKKDTKKTSRYGNLFSK